VKRISPLIILGFLFSLLIFPNASAFELKSECISTTFASPYPFAKPGPGTTAAYKVAYQNNCSKEITSVEISILERDGYNYRNLSSGGRLGKVLEKQKGEVTLSLSYSVYSETRDTIFLSIKEDYPLESKVKQALRNLDFTSAPTPTPSPSIIAIPPGGNLPPGTYPGGSGPQSSPSPSACDAACQAAKAAVVKAAADKAAADKAAADKAAADKAAAELKAKQDAEAKAAADRAAAELAAQKLQRDDFNSAMEDYQKLLLRIYNLKIKYPRASNLVGIEEKMLRMPISLGIDLSTAKYNIQSVNASLDASEKVWEKTQKTTITCVKGKFTKKVTAVKPVCPAGYKKK
jgi:hypothetical protein